METTFDDKENKAVLSGGQTMYIHPSTQCRGQACPVHKPSDHAYRQYPLVWDGEAFLFLRQTSEDSRIVDPDDYTLNKAGKAVVRNSATCLKCNVDIQSRHRHDFRSCKCGAIFVDGGYDYIRMGGHPENLKNTSIVASLDDYK